MNDHVKKGYHDERKTGEAILQELQRILGTGGKFLKRDNKNGGNVEVDKEAALQSKCSSSV